MRFLKPDLAQWLKPSLGRIRLAHVGKAEAYTRISGFRRALPHRPRITLGDPLDHDTMTRPNKRCV